MSPNSPHTKLLYGCLILPLLSHHLVKTYSFWLMGIIDVSLAVGNLICIHAPAYPSACVMLEGFQCSGKLLWLKSYHLVRWIIPGSRGLPIIHCRCYKMNTFISSTLQKEIILIIIVEYDATSCYKAVRSSISPSIIWFKRIPLGQSHIKLKGIVHAYILLNPRQLKFNRQYILYLHKPWKYFLL